LALALALAAGTAAAQERVTIQVVVAQLSEQAGPIDPRAEKLHRKLREQFRYESLSVLETRRLDLALNEVGSLRLPTGQDLRVRPLQISERGLLMAVDWVGKLETDSRVKNGHLFVMGPERYRDGKLVVSLEPQF
jgi:hypothetical protein